MKLGIITDIHEHVENLRTALARFEAERVDQVVVIGDVFEMGERIRETCQLLKEANAIGVWGNHDYGLCVEPDTDLRIKYGHDVINFMTSLRAANFPSKGSKPNRPPKDAKDVLATLYFPNIAESTAIVVPLPLRGGSISMANLCCRLSLIKLYPNHCWRDWIRSSSPSKTSSRKSSHFGHLASAS